MDHDEADEMWVLEMDSVVGWYVEVLLSNIVKPFVEFTDDDESEADAKLELLHFLLSNGLAKREFGASEFLPRFVATKKLLQKSDWLLAGRAPDKKVDTYMKRLATNFLRFLGEKSD